MCFLIQIIHKSMDRPKAGYSWRLLTGLLMNVIIWDGNSVLAKSFYILRSYNDHLGLTELYEVEYLWNSNLFKVVFNNQ